MSLILIVEDDKDIQKMIHDHLKLAGFDVVTAADGREALSKVAEKQPDLIILDIMLPNIDGWEVLLQLRDNPETQNIPVIMLTAKAEDLSKLTAFRQGADDYVTKPFNPDELVARIKAILKRSAAVKREAKPEERPTTVKIPVLSANKTVLIASADIIYCRNEAGQTYLHTYSQSWPTQYSLIELEDRLPAEQFFRCHRSFLVNLGKVKEIVALSSRGCLLTVDDETKSQVPVSRRSVKALREILSL